jgi:hypothetical protein
MNDSEHFNQPQRIPKKERQIREQRTKKQKINKTQMQYEHQCQSHTCSETINSSMYDSDFSIRTFPLTSSAPYNG